MSAKAAAMTETELLGELGALADAIDRVNADRDQLYARRKALFLDGRRREPPIGTRILAEAARCSDVLVTQLAGGRKNQQSTPQPLRT